MQSNTEAGMVGHAGNPSYLGSWVEGSAPLPDPKGSHYVALAGLELTT